MKNENKKWFTISEYVDVHTGEIISKSLQEREYIIIKKTKTVNYNEKEYNTTKYIYQCERDRQQKLW